MKTIVVSGALANKPGNGGEAWVRLSWILGLKRLGFRTVFVEQIDPRRCVDASGKGAPLERSINALYFDRVLRRFGLIQDAMLVSPMDRRVHGGTWSGLLSVCDSAELLINISGNLGYEPLLSRFRTKVYVDIDPGFTQFWHADPSTAFRLPEHDFYYTIGENIGAPDCPIPTAGIEWRPIRQPVVLEEWPATSPAAPERFSTLASWRGSFGPVHFGGRVFGLKVHEFRKIIDLPRHAAGTFELALDIDAADQRDREDLESHGWRLVDPRRASASPDDFRRYVQGSGAEFSVAQGIYVDTNSGWFSDRTVRYLATGRPALIQDTGFSRSLPCGEGLLGFRSLAEAVNGAAEIRAHFPRHARAAREIAEEFFDSDRVLSRLLGEIGLHPRSSRSRRPCRPVVP